MRNINLNNLTNNDLIDHAALSLAFKQYLINTLEYDEFDADLIVENDFENPYDAPFIFQEFEGPYSVDGKKYEVYSCHTDLRGLVMFYSSHVAPFEFYMFIDKDDLIDNRVGTYSNARKLYLL